MTKFSRILSEARFKKETLPDGTVRTEDENCTHYIRNGELHRVDGPAIIDKKNGVEEYWVNGKCHRIDGPATIDIKTGEEEYFVNGKKLSKEEFYKHFGDK